MKAVVGSDNPVKIKAVSRILGKVYPHVRVVGLAVQPDVPDQPWGDEQCRRGAIARARRALALAGADLGVGLEGGVLETEHGLMTCAWCAVVDRRGVIGLGGGVNLLLPPRVAALVRQGMELGSAMDEITGLEDTKRRMGAVGLLTGGLSNRQEAYEHVVKIALARFVKPEYYEGDG
ncbi:MAG: inosine/xanthosine triphosphatase [Anaerolineae bacterium]